MALFVINLTTVNKLQLKLIAAPIIKPALINNCRYYYTYVVMLLCTVPIIII